MDILKRAMAPITTSAWSAIDEQAVRTLKANLSARRFVDVEGPLGWECCAVNTGRLKIGDEQDGVGWGVRLSRPLTETRMEFELSLCELDSADRGAMDIDLSALEEAAVSAAHFEEKAVYGGFAEGCITGLAEAGEPQMMELGTGKAKDILLAVSKGAQRLGSLSVGGPYVLVGGDRLFEALDSCSEVYPVRKMLEPVVGDRIVHAPHFDGALLVSTRGGDMNLTVGQDFSIGYKGTCGDKVQLFITESFTFTINEPRAILTYRVK